MDNYPHLRPRWSLDLLPLYQSGEASADTRALVEAFLAGDAQARLAATGAVTPPFAAAPWPPPKPSGARRSSARAS